MTTQDEERDENPENSGRDPSTGRFLPGNPGWVHGRPKGVPNHRNRHLRDAIIAAATKAGLEVDPEADDGLEAYLQNLARTEKRAYASLLSRLLPMVPVKVPLPPIETSADLIAARRRSQRASWLHQTRPLYRT
jgi:hypothetical protein